ncbi:hypothetical protein GE061_019286 [Apolygus lucorum]|uniref:Uncharacterized protein n=1 Tax=Apolygus lucorum TaxID=248454 RepID=A0A8S9X992_APOLU|nr:hypothetical protein GE061_019286 [Apolygus lucorum]
MTSQIVKLMFLAGLAFAAPDLERVKRGYGGSGAGASAGSFASSSSSSSAGGVGGGQPSGGYSGGGGNAGGYNGGGYSGGGVGQSSVSSSGAGSLSGGGGFGKPANYGSDTANAIPGGPYGNNGGGRPYGNNGGGGAYGGGYASGFPGGSYAGNGGLPFNMPAGCFPGFQNFGPDPYQIHQEIMNNLKRLHEENLRFGAGGDGGVPGGFNGPQSGGGNVGAFASGSIGPGGGSGYAGVLPSNGPNLRFGDTVPQGPVQSTSGSFPAPSGDFYGIQTSSSSSSKTVNGQTETSKKSQVAVNDNGKVTTYTASDP